MSKLLKSKTVITAIITVMSGIAGYFLHDPELMRSAQMVFTGLLAMFLRDALKKMDDGEK